MLDSRIEFQTPNQSSCNLEYDMTISISIITRKPAIKTQV